MSACAPQRVALVTGGTRGIGAAIVERLLTDGYCVATCARTTSSVTSPADLLMSADVTCESDVDAVFTEVEGTLGPVAIVVNNAGSTSPRPLTMTRSSDFDAALGTNLRAPFLVTRRASRQLIRRRWGRIVNVGSVAAVLGVPGQVAYASSKAGLAGLTCSTAAELRPRGVTCNLLLVGVVRTSMLESATERAQHEILSRIPMRRFGRPDEIAGAVSFLVSDAGRSITGSTIAVDGGLTAALV